MAPLPLEHLFLITGTTRGIGKALVASALLQPNSFVVSLSRAAPFIRENHQNIRIDPSFEVCTVAPGTVDTAMQEKIRDCRPDQFDQVDKFLKLKAKGALYPPERAATALIRLLMDGRFTNGGRYDLREMGG